jgi:hypothetical protein
MSRPQVHQALASRYSELYLELRDEYHKQCLTPDRIPQDRLLRVMEPEPAMSAHDGIANPERV